MSVRNKCTFIGRTGGDIDVHIFDNGDRIGNVSIAIDESYKKKDTGDKVERTTWVNLTARNKLCELFEKYVSKGDKVVVECKYAPRKWESDDKSGVAHEFVVLGLELVSSSSNQSEQKPKTEKKDPAGVADSSDDLPF